MASCKSVLGKWDFVALAISMKTVLAVYFFVLEKTLQIQTLQPKQRKKVNIVNLHSETTKRFTGPIFNIITLHPKVPNNVIFILTGAWSLQTPKASARTIREIEKWGCQVMCHNPSSAVLDKTMIEF